MSWAKSNVNGTAPIRVIKISSVVHFFFSHPIYLEISTREDIFKIPQSTVPDKLDNLTVHVRIGIYNMDNTVGYSGKFLDDAV